MPNNLLSLAATSVATVALIYLFPEYLVPDRFSRRVLRFLIVDSSIFIIWRCFIYPFFFNPLRNIPGPTASLPMIPGALRSH
jgi:hypothetical protein